MRISNEICNEQLEFTLSVDGNNVSQANKISHKYKATIRGCNFHNLITLNGLYGEEAKEKLLNTPYYFQLSVDVNVVVM